MENEFTFRIFILVLLIAFVLHRGYYTRKYDSSEDSTIKKREEGWITKIAWSAGMLGFISTGAFIFKPTWLVWTSIPLPVSVRWMGVVIALLGFTLLHWAQNTLGKNWSDTPRMMKAQKLVTTGPYQWIRHPIYTAFLLILGAIFLASANWLIGVSFIGMTALEISSRIRFEESLMIEYFGNEYREYMERTGRVFPKVG